MRTMIGLVLFSLPCFAGSMSSLKNDGENFAKQGSTQAIDSAKNFSTDDFAPVSARGRTFDSENALRNIDEGKKPHSEAVGFLLSDGVQKNERDNKGFNEKELFLKRSEEIFSGKEALQEFVVEEEVGHSMQKCKQAGDPFLISVVRTLQVQVKHKPEEKKKVKICQGHRKTKKYTWKSDAKKECSEIEKELKKDKTIKHYQVSVEGGGMFSDYSVKARWNHKKDTKWCSRYKMQERILHEERWEEEGEEWVYDNPDALTIVKSPDSTLIDKTCLDATTTKVINGKEVTRKCWKEQLSYLYQIPYSKECDFLRERNCEQIHQNCLQPTQNGCALWELTFKCFSKIVRRVVVPGNEPYGLDGNCWEIGYEQNSSFAEVATKLSVFEEIKKEMEKSQSMDAKSLRIFKGKKMQCSKNVAGDLMYDCCFAYSGLANRMHLSKCSSDELSLAEMREKGLCHYVGHYEEKMLDLWKSRDEHVFCCFPSKLSRIVQEEGRKQLKISWGEAEEPNCGGFAVDQLSQLNFAKMDLSEICDQMPRKMPDNFQGKLESFQNRLQEEVANADKKE